MKPAERRFSNHLFAVYCSMIEFINDLRLPSVTCMLLVCFQTMCMVLQQMTNIRHSVSLLQLLEYLGVLQLVHLDSPTQVQTVLCRQHPTEAVSCTLL